MAKDIKGLIKTGGVLQCQPTKAFKEAPTRMNNNSTVYKIPSWNYLIYDLDAVSSLSNDINVRSIKYGSVANLFEGYSLLCLIKDAHRKTKLYDFSVSFKELTQRIHFGDFRKHEIQSTNKILNLFSESGFYNYSPLFITENKSSDIVEFHLHSDFDYLICTVIKVKDHHDSLKITKPIYEKYLKKIKRQQRAYGVFLEKLHQESKSFLERSAFLTSTDRSHNSLARIKKIFNPSSKHSANEIYKSGELLLRKIFGNNIEDEIRSLSRSLVTEDEFKKFSDKKFTTITNSISAVSDLFDGEHVANDNFYLEISKNIGRS